MYFGEMFKAFAIHTVICKGSTLRQNNFSSNLWKPHKPPLRWLGWFWPPVPLT